MVYSPKIQKNQLDINFKKSPQKFVFYDSPKEPQPYPLPQQKTYFDEARDYQNIKKKPDEIASLRQTMNHSQGLRLAKRHTLY